MTGGDERQSESRLAALIAQLGGSDEVAPYDPFAVAHRAGRVIAQTAESTIWLARPDGDAGGRC